MKTRVDLKNYIAEENISDNKDSAIDLFKIRYRNKIIQKKNEQITSEIQDNFKQPKINAIRVPSTKRIGEKRNE